jgi:hypothetical protein
MEHNGIEARIFVVEQKDAGHWNKGRLYNIGFQQATAHNLAFGEASWLFSDVDVFETVPGRLAYKDCVSASDGSIHHLYGIGGGTSMYTEGVLGGMFCLPSRLYTNVNGFSNRFWGWGFEDSDFEHRMRAAGVAVNRSALIPRLGARGDCLSEIGLADLPTPKQQIKRNPKAYVLSKNPNVPIHTENAAAYLKDLQAVITVDGMGNLSEDEDFTIEWRYEAAPDKNFLWTQRNPRGFYRLGVALTCPSRCFKMTADCGAFGEVKTVSDCPKDMVEGKRALATCVGQELAKFDLGIFYKGKVYKEMNCQGGAARLADL